MSTDLPNAESIELEKEWMKAWRSAAIELPKIRANELKSLNDAVVFELMGHDEAFDITHIGLASQQA